MDFFVYFLPASYIKKYLGSPTDIDVERLQVEYEKLKDENLRLKKTVEELKKEVKINMNIYKCIDKSRKTE